VPLRFPERETIRNHLAKMPELANQPKADLSRGLTVAKVAEKHGWENCGHRD